MKTVISGSLTALALCCAAFAHAVEMQRWQTPDGVTVTLVERHELPIVNLSVTFKGAGKVGSEHPDIADFTADMLNLGAGEYDENRFADETNRYGISVSAQNDLENASVNLVSLSRAEPLDAAARLMNQMLTAPRFDEKVFKREQQQAVAAFRQNRSDPYFSGSRAFTAALYPNHPYGHSAASDGATIQAVTLDDIRAFHRRWYTKDHAYVAVVGDLNRKQAETLAGKILRNVPKAEAALPEIPKVAAHRGKCTYVPFDGKEQTVVIVGMPMGVYRDPDRFALTVGNYILGGGGFDSRLMKKLRDEMGLVYNVSSERATLTQAAPFKIVLSTKNDKADEAVTAVRQVVDEFLANGPTEAELKQAKDRIIGGFPLNFDTNAKTLSAAENAGVLNLPLDYLDDYPRQIAAVTAEQVRETWRRRLKTEQLDTVIVGSRRPSETVCGQ